MADATRAVEEARLFGERTLWFAARYHYVLGQLAELTAYRIADQPEVRDVLETLAAVKSSSEGISEQMPLLVGELREERIEAIEQLSESLDTATTRALDGLEERVRRARLAAVEHVFERLCTERERLFEAMGATSVDLHAAL